MSKTESNILLVEDTPSLAQVYLATLEKAGFSAEHVDTGKSGITALTSKQYRLVLLDLELPDMKGFELLKVIEETQGDCTPVMITAHGSINTAVEAMRLGAYDFLVKPFQPERLITTTRNALERTELKKMVETIRKTSRESFDGFIGSSLPMQAVYCAIESVANSKASVFLTGESGTGKEVCAKAIHHVGNRQDKPFIALNCGAIPKELMESEIFGHIKGSFTGAFDDRKGAAREANGGTLFLDEICEMDMTLQTKLLRFLQTDSVQPVGSSKAVDVDVRVVCATNKDPLEEVRAGNLREDLYYRLHVIPLHLPPLRDREDDVLAIAEHFLKIYSQEEGKGFKSFDEEVRGWLASYRWPGNVRQLQNVIRQIVVMNDAERVTLSMIPVILPLSTQSAADGTLSIDRHPTGGADSRGADSRGADERGADERGLGRMKHPHALNAAIGIEGESPLVNFAMEQDIEPLWVIERRIIESAIKICNGSIPRAAERLHISPSTIYRKKESWRAAMRKVAE